MSSRDIALRLINFGWGNEVNANYAGVSAQVRGSDFLQTVRDSATRYPEPMPVTQTVRGIPTGPVDNTSGPATVTGSTAETIAGYIPDIVTDTVSGVFGPVKDGKSLLRSGSLLLLAVIIIAIGIYALVK